ncbi:hypothetical protein D5S17_15025 [Pseudonocardiaceae bacterium YIM PH 21723]|nr:hypothetical protein D5S17_15025 [Pseudonocardiaceae bacterium YIM PH 21723]
MSKLLRPGIIAVGSMLSLALLAGPVSAAPAAVDTQASQEAAQVKVSRTEMLNRAKVWLTANGGKQVPYSMERNWKDGYRQDCSGYVSMAAKLPKPGPNTVGLFDSYTTGIAVKDMKPGDLFIDKLDRPGADFRHVVIFEKWVDASHKQYWAYEQRGGHGTDHRKLSYGLKADDYKPRRLKNITG